MQSKFFNFAYLEPIYIRQTKHNSKLDTKTISLIIDFKDKTKTNRLNQNKLLAKIIFFEIFKINELKIAFKTSKTKISNNKRAIIYEIIALLRLLINLIFRI